jgi:NAD(P)H dehydrogenase (quinone)
MAELLQATHLKLLKVGEVLGFKNLDPESGKIFVTGGAGVIGHRVALRLLNAGYPDVRLGSHHPHAFAEENKMGAEIADFSWDREDTYAKALVGVKSVLLTVAYTKNWERHFPAFLRACEHARIKHLVKLSFYHARMKDEVFQQVPLVKAHGRCDALLMKELTPNYQTVVLTPRMSYTILYASHYMSNVFTFQSKELHKEGTSNLATFFGASGNRGVNYVSPNDVAEVAVRVLLEPREYYDKEITLTGPEAITDQQVADLISKHFKKPVMYVDQPLREFQSEIQTGGDPDWLVQDLAAIESVKATGIEEEPSFATKEVEKICGHQAQTFEEYLQERDYMTAVEMGAEPELKPLRQMVM